MKALLLAAGQGLRLRPLTNDRPKPMVPVGGRPFINRSLAWLRANGVTDVAINLHHQPDALVNHLGDGSASGVSVRYSFESQLLGSAGALVPLRDFFAGSGVFVVLYGDVWTDLDLRNLVEVHRAVGSVLTMAVTTAEDPTRGGMVSFANDQRVTRFVEKPRREEAFSQWINAGIYVCDERLLGYLPTLPPVPFDFAAHFIPLLLARGADVRAFPAHGAVIDIGSPEGLRRADEAVRREALLC